MSANNSLQNIKMILRSILNASSRPLTMRDLEEEFQLLEQRRIPFSQLGFSRLDAFLASLTDTLVCKPQPDGSVRVYAIQTAKSQHITTLVRQQKPAKTGRRNGGGMPAAGGHPAMRYQQPNTSTNANLHASRHSTAGNRVAYRPSAPRPQTQPLRPYNHSNSNHSMAPNLAPSVNNLAQQIATHLTISNMRDAQHKQILLQQQQAMRLQQQYQLEQHLRLEQQQQQQPQQHQQQQQRHQQHHQQHQRQQQRQQQPQRQPTPPKAINNRPSTEPRQSTPSLAPPAPTKTNRLSPPQPELILSFPSSSAKPISCGPQLPPPVAQRARIRVLPADIMSNSSEDDTCGSRAANEPPLPLQTPHSRRPIVPRFTAKRIGLPDQIAPSVPTIRIKSTGPSNGRAGGEQPTGNGAALPPISFDDPLFISDMPDTVAKYEDAVQPAQLPAHVRPGAMIQLFVTEVNNPTKFWFHVQDDQHPLDDLMYRIEQYYDSPSSGAIEMRPCNAIPNLLCAARFNNLWHRAIIVGRLKDDHSIKVHFMDYGTTAPVALADIRYLLRDFAALRVQAFRGALAGVRPAASSAGSKWCRDASYAFLELVAEVMLYARVERIEPDDQTVRLMLINTARSDRMDVLVHEALVQQQLALPLANAPDEAGQRVRHYSELFPTFEQLEIGAYPSFGEIGAMMAQGIEFAPMLDNLMPLAVRMEIWRQTDGLAKQQQLRSSANANVHQPSQQQQQQQQRRFHPSNPFASDFQAPATASSQSVGCWLTGFHPSNPFWQDLEWCGGKSNDSAERSNLSRLMAPKISPIEKRFVY